MKVFFRGSPRYDLEMCRKIYRSIETLGHKHTSKFMIEVDPKTFYQSSDDDWGKRYKKAIEEISESDACIIEASIHSMAMGQLVQEISHRDKPLIILYKEARPYFFRGLAEVDSRIQLLEYTQETITEVLKYGLDIASELLTTRFTMLIPAQVLSDVDEISKRENISKSEYIRKLISQDIKLKRMR